MYDDILIPTDGSDPAREAVEHAIEFAEQFGARVHALYVVDASAYAALDTATDTVIHSLEEEGEATVSTVADAAGERDLAVTTAVVSGTPHQEIVDYVEDNGIDLIVMGTHGRRGIDRYLLGSVTEKVVRTADAPVLTVRMDSEE